MTIIALIRHGQNDWVTKKRLAGWTPGVRLNDEGRRQAEETAARLAHLPLKAVYSSPLERCLETAAAVARPHQLPVVELEGVGEVRFGRWEGEKLKKLARTALWPAVQHFPGRFRFPDGESFLEVQQRAVAALEQLSLSHPQELIAVVSHADVIKLVLAHYLGLHVDLFQRITLAPAAVSVIALADNGGIQVLRVNDTGRLEMPEQPKGKKATKKGKGRQPAGHNGANEETS